ncbi:NAD(P)H-hydrate dehydratase [Dorea formicigenerans]|uniref:NAD(P)H-hydrate dehydratase n=1 Tax=Dorea formicigenerans TaxID=39486 RepID=UPI001D025970|nr:NAD(P)H-hydrate dehydratase [Dorea formicigenerans]MCB5502335.1 NAD(P)H-hydrate dehydratase [Dorea formicigenerans]
MGDDWMQLWVNAAQMKAADQYTIQKLGVPSLELMEHAAQACVQVLEDEKFDLSHVCVVCGSGNNGGDGFAIARILQNNRYSVETFCVGNPEHYTEETQEQMYRLQECGGKITYGMPQEDSYSVIIDAVFGVGLSRKVEGRYRQVIEQMNRMRGTKFAVDIPSGLSATTGYILGCAFKADYTVTFQLKKIGLELSQGRTMAGKVIVPDIGISTDSICEDQEIVRTAGKDIYRKMLPDRPEDSNKGTYGRLLVIAGSKGMAGAAYLNAHAAYMTGAGLVRIYTSSDNREILQTLLPEAIITTYEEYNKEELLSLLTWADGVCIGSGLGMSRLSEKILKTVIEYVKVPCLIDADGLNLLAENNNYLNQMAERRFVITPHMKEMSRLTGTPVEELKADRIQILKDFISRYRITCVLKDSRTLIASEEKGIRMNLTGNSAMAKAGSGDVLAGVISGWMVQGKEAEDAAELGTYIHGLSGDLAKFEKGVYSVMARDLIEYISKALMKLEEE